MPHFAQNLNQLLPWLGSEFLAEMPRNLLEKPCGTRGSIGHAPRDPIILEAIQHQRLVRPASPIIDQRPHMHGGKVNGDYILIKVQQPVTVKFEKSFERIYPVAKIPVTWSANRNEMSFDFEGTGFVIKGETARWGSGSSYVFNTELYVDDKLVESPNLPASYTTRRYELCWKYDLPKGKHTVRLKILNPSKDEEFNSSEAIIYSDQLIDGMKVNEAASKHVKRETSDVK